MRILSIFFICSIAMFSLCAAPAQGVQVDGSTAAPKVSFKEKLSTFHGKLKQRLDSLRGIDSTEDAADQTQQDTPVDHFQFDQRRMQSGAGTRQAQPSSHRSRQAYPQQSRPQYQPPQIAQTSYVERRLGGPAEPQHDNGGGYSNSQQGHQNFDHQMDYRNQYQPAQVINVPPFPVGVQVNEPMSTTSYSTPNQGRLTNGARPNSLRGEFDHPHQTQQTSNFGQFNNAGDQSMVAQQTTQSPMTSAGHMNAAASHHRTGHFQNGFARVQTLSDQQQVTASERVLQLQAQNETLVAQRNALLAENKRLNNIIAENQKMLGQADIAIGSSLTQLKTANHKNEVLKQQIARLQSESKMQKAESKRMLDSIRQRLDDVLIREISSK